MAENAILEELRRQAGGLAFLPRAWLARPIRVFKEKKVQLPVGYPRDLRTLDQYLRKLEKFGEIVHVRAGDGGVWYALRDTYAGVQPSALDSLRRAELPSRGSPTRMAILFPGPAALGADFRSKIWSVAAELPDRFVLSPIVGLHDLDTGEALDPVRVTAGADQEWVELELTTERKPGKKIGYTSFDLAGNPRSHSRLVKSQLR